MKARLLICAFMATMVLAPAVAAEPGIAPEEAMCTSGDEPTIGHLSALINYIFMSHIIGAGAYELDYDTDCMIDRSDYDLCQACFDDPFYCDFFPQWPITTCCDPVLIWSLDTARARGDVSLAFEGGTASVTGVGSSGDDGVRLWPNMEENWRSGVRVGLDNIELGGDFSEGAACGFTGVKQGYDLEWLAWAEASHDGGVIDLTLGLGQLTQATIALRASAGGDEIVSTTFGGSELTLSGNAINGTPAITAVSLVYASSTIFAMEFDRAIEFTVEGESPPVAFTADRLVLSSENTLQPVQGLGPFEVTATDLGWFSVSFEEFYLPCVGRVGDANGLGGDEPTISDVSSMIDFLFISASPGAIASLTEADINQSGGCDLNRDDITIGDVSILIDYLFITGSELGLPDCLDCP